VGWGESLVVHLPFSIYLRWITIATISNVSVYLVSIGWDGFGISPETWAALILMIATAIAALVMITRRDIAYAQVIVWAFVGIAREQESNLNVVTFVGVGVVTAVLVLSILRARRRMVGGGPA
jgi:hypothetical protein